MLNTSTIAEMNARRNKGESIEAIALDIGVTPETVRRHTPAGLKAKKNPVKNQAIKAEKKTKTYLIPVARIAHQRVSRMYR